MILSSVSSIALSSTIPSLSDAPLAKPMLILGDTGSDVVELQRLLLHWAAFSGYTSDAGDDLLNGRFDGCLRRAVERFQAAMFLQPDGVVGALTWRSLYTGEPARMPQLQSGSTGIEVTRLQHLLVGTCDLPTDYRVNGVFDSITEQAVCHFQQRLGLGADGVVDESTWYALSRVLGGLPVT